MPFGFPQHALHPQLAPRKVGIMGGSFNPPHAGHLQLARQAMAKLGLDQVWWLVSPQNPMKPSDETRPYDERFYACEQMTADDQNIIISDFEDLLDLQLSADTVKHLEQAFPNTDFVWIMGTDILEELHLWEKVDEFVASIPLAVFSRPGSVMSALNSTMARKLKQYCYFGPARGFMSYAAPAWTYVPMPMVDLSSTQIREQLSKAKTRINTQRGGPVAPGQPGQTVTAKRKGKALPTPEALRDIIVSKLEDDKVEELNVVDLSGKSSLADYMVIGTGRASTHVKAMSDHIQREVKNAGIQVTNVAGQGNGDWVLIDTGDVIVHLFRPEVREFYQLDKLWDPELLPES